MLDLAWMRATESVPPTWLIDATWWGAHALFSSVPSAQLSCSGLTGPLPRPVLFAQNHTHFFDWLPPRYLLYKFFEMQCDTWIKIRGFQEHPLQGKFLAGTGNIPLGSRGYILAADWSELLQERPSDETYRLLRDHVDSAQPLPDTPAFERLQNTPRSILGHRFDPSTTTWRQAVQDVFVEMMEISLEKGRRAVGAGFHMHIYPEGTISSRLFRARSGAIEIALAMGLDLLPTGVSGARDFFSAQAPRPAPHTHLHVRFGTPYVLDRPPEGYVPFAQHQTPEVQAWLDARVADLMDRIDALLEPEYRRDPEWDREEGTQGVDRFII